MIWDNRIFKSEKGYGLCETFYSNEGEVAGWTEPDLGWFETVEELKEHIGLLFTDVHLDREVLEYGEE